MADRSSIDPYDVNGQHFNPDLYLQRLIKDCTLKKILDEQDKLIKDTQSLHSDMQTLVYENYNKFISATDTIRKMKNDFKKMEDEMDSLADNMTSITNLSENISSTLQDTRLQITELSSVHALLKKLQFLFKLPSQMKISIQAENYNQAVQDYIHAQRVLEQYGKLPSFQGIQIDCEEIVADLKKKLRDQFKSKNATAKQLTESVDLLLQLNEPAPTLCADFLSHAESQLSEQLTLLQEMTEQDLIEFVDAASAGFLSDLCLVIKSYSDMLISHNKLSTQNEQSDDADVTPISQLHSFILINMERYFEIVNKRIEKEQEDGDTLILVRALDRFHRRLQAMNTIFTDIDFARTGTEIVLKAGRRQCQYHIRVLKTHFADGLTHIRQQLVTPKVAVDSHNSIADLLSHLILSIVGKVKGVLQDILVFAQRDLTFGLKSYFRQVLCVEYVRENVVVGFLHHLTATARSFCTTKECKAPPALLLILSKLCYEFKVSHVEDLLRVTDEWFAIEDCSASKLITQKEELVDNLDAAAQELLNSFVRLQGLHLSQMLRKSVETRDWLHTIEPRTVRAVMKRVVEDITSVDSQVGMLYEEGKRTERSSDSSRRTHSASVSRHALNYSWSSYASNQMDSSLVTTNIQKIFSEPIEIYASVEFSKISILTGIIKISLKTFLECVRLYTFSRYGLQQIQVDTHYLQLYLWRFVADENLVHFLLDEILGSAGHRCLDPVLMEPSIVGIICERG